MNIRFEASFAKDLRRLRDTHLKRRLRNTIDTIKSADDLATIPNLRKLQGHSTYYRIRVGDYRIGIEYSDEIVTLVRILHRKDIYRRFP